MVFGLFLPDRSYINTATTNPTSSNEVALLIGFAFQYMVRDGAPVPYRLLTVRNDAAWA
jgi:hypothetical protein